MFAYKRVGWSHSELVSFQKEQGVIYKGNIKGVVAARIVFVTPAYTQYLLSFCYWNSSTFREMFVCTIMM